MAITPIYQLLLTELCNLLDLPRPEPASDDASDHAYAFERPLGINQPDDSSNSFIYVIKRGSFVLEARHTGKSGWDEVILKAHNQADQYATTLIC